MEGMTAPKGLVHHQEGPWGLLGSEAADQLKAGFLLEDSWSLEGAESRRNRKNASILTYSGPIHLALC